MQDILISNLPIPNTTLHIVSGDVEFIVDIDGTIKVNTSLVEGQWIVTELVYFIN